jgi:hypothetical protein
MGQCQKGCNTAGGDKVVPTGMADVRQRIVFSVEVNQLAFSATDTFERCIYSVGMPGNCESLAFKEVADGIMGLVLFICQFWIRPNVRR